MPTECDTCFSVDFDVVQVLFFFVFAAVPHFFRPVVLSLVGVAVEVAHRLLSLLRDVVGIFSQYVQPRRHTRLRRNCLLTHVLTVYSSNSSSKPCPNTVISQLLLALLASPPPSAENSMREQHPISSSWRPSLTHTRLASLGLQICPTRSIESPSRRAFISPLWSSVSPRFISSPAHGLRTPLLAPSTAKLTLLLVCRRVGPRQVDPSQYSFQHYPLCAEGTPPPQRRASQDRLHREHQCWYVSPRLPLQTRPPVCNLTRGFSFPKTLKRTVCDSA